MIGSKMQRRNTTNFPLCGLFCGMLAVMPLSAFGQAVTPPTIQAKDLNGRAFVFPRDVTGNPALGIFVHSRGAANESGRVKGLVAQVASTNPALTLREFPIISAPALARGLIDQGMRSGIPGTEPRAKIITLYVSNMAAWRRATGLQNPNGVWLAKLSSGTITASVPSSALRTRADVQRFIDGR
jgi:hypothetical protein